MAWRDVHWFYRWGGAVLKQSLGRYLSVRCEGLDYLPRGRPFILASNHSSLLDPPLLCAYVMPEIGGMLSPAATKGLFVWPLSTLLRGMDAFEVDRTTRRNLTSVRQILDALKQRAILIFPEGGIVPHGETRRGQLGVGFLARNSGVPVVPAAVLGTDKALPKGGRWIRRVPVSLRFGPSLSFGDSRRGYSAITDEIMHRIHRLKSSYSQDGC